MDVNPIRTALKVCNNIINQSVYAVVVSHSYNGDLSPAAVSHTSGFFHIPNIHVSFLRTVPPYSHQADVWIKILRHFRFRRFILIHSSDKDGRALMRRIQSISQNMEEEMKVLAEAVTEFEPGLESFADQLQILRNSTQSHVFLLYAKKNDSEIIFRDAQKLNLTGISYVWIVTEQALDADNIPVGTLGLRLVNATNEKIHIKDSIYVFKSAFLQMNKTELITSPPRDCGDSAHVWETGKSLFEIIRKQNLVKGETGNVAFDEKGDRINAEYDIININAESIQSTVGKYHYSNSTPNHLKVLTIEEKPFVYVREINDNDECSPNEISCARFNSSVGPKKEWTGLIGELVNERADMIVAPLTINLERAEFIEFSKPFKYQGITILEKKPLQSTTVVSFLQPFSNTLWILVLVSVNVVALVLYLLDRFSPFSLLKKTNSEAAEENALNMQSALWFAWSVLLNSGIGEGTPKSCCTRVLGMIWAGFAMIIFASYTANLAAFLVLARPKTKLTGINDARLRNTMENLTYATVRGSAVDMYFQRQAELSNMYRTMEANNYDTAEAAIRDVKNGKLMAFIWDSARLEYEAAQDCELVTSGELFGHSGYGIGLTKGSRWADAVTIAILNFHESGVIDSLDHRWILQNNVQHCDKSDKPQHTLGLKNMAGVFMLVAGGIIGGSGLIIVEVIYRRHQIRKERKLRVARYAAHKWRGIVQKRKILRATLCAQRGLCAVSLSLDSIPQDGTDIRKLKRVWP
ncbi:hypothetical protein L9F63_001536, partial [Diploptera punctata]